MTYRCTPESDVVACLQPGCRRIAGLIIRLRPSLLLRFKQEVSGAARQSVGIFGAASGSLDLYFVPQLLMVLGSYCIAGRALSTCLPLNSVLYLLILAGLDMEQLIQ